MYFFLSYSSLVSVGIMNERFIRNLWPYKETNNNNWPFLSNMLLGTFRELQVDCNTCLSLAYSLFPVTQY